MLLGLEIGLLIYGIYALTKGQFQLGKDKILEGRYARILAILCILPLPLAVVIGFVAGFIWAITHGTSKQFPQGMAIGFEVVLVILCCIAIVVVGKILYSRQTAEQLAETEEPPPPPPPESGDSTGKGTC